MSVELTNHLWQSTLFAVLAGLLSIVLKKNSARVRYGLWLAASLKFLVPFALLMSIGRQLESVPAAQKFATQIPAPAASYTIQFTQPFLPASTAAPSPAISNDKAVQWVPGLLMSVWFLGFGSILYMRWRGWLRIRAAVRASIPLQLRSLDNVRASEDVLEPAVVGTVRPILLLPSDITNRLPWDQLQAVLAHELCHVRRRDNLTSSLHMIVEAVFWFHPLVWWIGSRLVVERERACDEEVLRLGNEPMTYAEGILNVCKSYQASPLACVSGVTGSDLKTRIEEILKNRAVLKLSFGKLMLLATAAFFVLAGPVAVGVVHATSGRVPASRSMTAVVATVVHEAAVPLAPPSEPPRLPRPSRPLLKPQAPDTFEVVSIRPAAPGQPAPGGARGARGGGPATPTPCGGGVQLNPGRITLRNSTVYRLITLAYGKNCRATDSIGLIERLPDWVSAQAFDIEATFPSGTPAYTMMQLQNGEAPRLQTMLQSMLASRFNLALHRSTKDAPLYNLVYVKGGKIIRSADQTPPPPLQPPSGPPQPRDPAADPPPFPRGGFSLGVDPPAGLVMLQASSVPISTLINIFQGQEGRFVVDKTGLLGLYDIPEVTLNVGPFEIGPNAVSVWPEIMQQLGLKLEPARGPLELLVVDRLDKPSEN